MQKNINDEEVATKITELNIHGDFGVIWCFQFFMDVTESYVLSDNSSDVITGKEEWF